MNKNNKKSDVSWVKPAEPSFLKKFKSDVGYKEGPTVDTKRQVMPELDDDSGSDREDELPQVVVLKKGDLSADEVKKMKGGDGGTEKAEKGEKGEKAEKEDEPRSDGKILFKKPAKRSSSDKFQGITASSSKKKKSEGGEDGEEKEKREEKEKEKEKREEKEKEKEKREEKEKEKREEKEKEKREEKPAKKVKNNSLLSFGGDDDEDED